MDTIEKDLLLLDRRVTRLKEEYLLKTPTLIIKTELELIRAVCDKLLKNLK